MEFNYAATSFIVNNFKAFYYEILKQKARALKALHQLDSHGTNVPNAQELCQNIQYVLAQMLETQSLDAVKQIGEFAVTHYQEAQYVMVALADEIFLGFEWEGRHYWTDHLLEAKVFHTQVAGELFFQRLDYLLTTLDPVKKDLAIVYIFALALGFLGRYRGNKESEELRRYRQQLFIFLCNQPSDLLHENRKYLVETPYQHNIVIEQRRFLPEVRLWFYAFAAIIFLYIFVSYALWHYAVGDLQQVINHIIEQSKATS